MTPREDEPTFVRGVAMAAQVLNPKYEDDWGKIHLLVHFGEIGVDPSVRTYHISLRGTIAYVIEMFPQEGWRERPLAKIEFSHPEAHTMRIEYNSEDIAFFIDGEPIDLKNQPDLPTNSAWKNWVIEGYVFPQQEGAALVLDALVDWVAVMK